LQLGDVERAAVTVALTFFSAHSTL
jgi:hypothetical protein